MTDFEDRLVAVFAELHSTGGITVDDADEGSLATWLTGPDQAFEVIRKVAGVRLAPLMAGNFHRYDELRCYWRGAGEDASIGGEFWLTHLVNVCVGSVPDGPPDAAWPAGAWPPEGPDRWYLCNVSEVFGPEERELVVHAFDSQGKVGIGALAGFARGDDGFTTVDGTAGHPEIWFSVNTDGTLVRLDITYPEYLDALLLTRGLFGWQYLYADPRDPGFGFYRPKLGPGLDFLERTFPQDDFSGLRARWNAHLRARDA
ncbi:hypothetical protein [Streptomyces sp. NPDC049879]|uniref:hypothetical protein n=1 Tax=Streptomyces sp. NPDC049879 TaxID=3365598 RepID=UPI0037B46470